MQVERPRIQVRSGLLIAGKDHPKSVHNQPSSTDQDRDQSLVCYISSSEDEEDPLVAFHGNVHSLLAASEDALAEPQDEVICIEEEDGPSLAVSSECIPVVLDNELEDSYVKEVKDCVETVTTSKPGSPLQPPRDKDNDVKDGCIVEIVKTAVIVTDPPLQPPCDKDSHVKDDCSVGTGKTAVPDPSLQTSRDKDSDVKDDCSEGTGETAVPDPSLQPPREQLVSDSEVKELPNCVATAETKPGSPLQHLHEQLYDDSDVEELEDCSVTADIKPGSPLQPVCELVYEDSDVKELEDCVAVETMTPDMPLQPPPPRAQLFMCKRCPRQFCLKDNLIKHRRTQHKRCVYVLATCCVAPSA